MNNIVLVGKILVNPNGEMEITITNSNGIHKGSDLLDLLKNIFKKESEKNKNETNN